MTRLFNTKKNFLFVFLQQQQQQQFWSAYAPCSSQHLDAVQLTLEQIDLIRRLVNLYPQHMALVTTADGKTTHFLSLSLRLIPAHKAFSNKCVSL